MKKRSNSPRIRHLSWGRIEVEGDRIYKDAKLFPGGSREWDWNETGTRHTPGIQPADVEELSRSGATTVILSKGILERLRVCPETLQLLKENGITVFRLQTEKAARLYNKLREHENVGGLFHTTC